MRRTALCTSLLSFAVGASPTATMAEPETPALERVVVTETRRPVTYLSSAGNTATIEHTEIETTRHTHVSELMYRAPGTWVMRGSGQENLTAIRSPVLTGAGACGAFLFLEDGIPLRPSGFCNINQLFEINTEQVKRVEIVRGPAATMYGSNALHGMINYLFPYPAAGDVSSAVVEIGSDDYYRASTDLGSWDGQAGLKLLANVTHDGGFRDDSGFDQAKVNLLHSRTNEYGGIDVAFAATRLDQDTAGFIFGQDAYKDDNLRERNLNPEAFRNADSQRLTARWYRTDAKDQYLDVRAFYRRSRMEFLQHFLPGQPLEENGQNSAGVLVTVEHPAGNTLTVIGGVDVEVTDGFLLEDQAESITDGSPFLMETRPAGKHYDYSVTAFSLAPHIAVIGNVTDRLTLSAGVRAEYLRYEYDNKMLDGNTRDDGTECGMGGCLFNRPADRDDSFSNVAPKLGLVYANAPTSRIYATLRQGFRAPQATELYRLQRQQTVADLESEEIDSIELGWRGQAGAVWYDAALFYMKKRNFIFRDADGINVSDGKTTHRGIELDFSYAVTDTLTFALAGTFAVHEYDFDRDIGGGDAIQSGNEMDTAPETLGSARLNWLYDPTGRAELEWIHVGDYYLNAANTATYNGHDLLNLRIQHRFDHGWNLGLRITNLLDEIYAERADFAFGDYRYFPGRDRSYFLEIGYRPR